MKLVLWKIGILFRKDLLEQLSYRLSFFLEASGILFYTFTFYFIALMFGGHVPKLDRYGGDYFSFVLIGLAFSSFLNLSLDTFSNSIRTEQLQGTLEALLAAPTSPAAIFIARLLWNFVHSGLHMIGYFVLGIFFLSASYSGANVAAVPLILILSLLAFNGMGMISAGFILAFKRGNPLNIFLGFASAFLGGVFFPVDVLPAALQKIAAFVPVTYSLRLMRDACMNGAGFRELAPDFLVLAAICAVLLPAGALFFNWALRRAKRDGSLTHY